MVKLQISKSIESLTLVDLMPETAEDLYSSLVNLVTEVGDCFGDIDMVPFTEHVGSGDSYDPVIKSSDTAIGHLYQKLNVVISLKYSWINPRTGERSTTSDVSLSINGATLFAQGLLSQIIDELIETETLTLEQLEGKCEI
jgi:hypothetical protein